MKSFRFYSEIDEWYGKRWFADIPEWEGTKEELEMVCGADKMLDILAGEREEINLWLDFDDNQADFTLAFIREGQAEGGGYYWFEFCKGAACGMEIWLCDVTKFVFGDLPKFLYGGVSHNQF